MLVLRKEIKMGLGIGAAVLGIAAVYGLMAMLSSSGSHQPGGTETVATSTDVPHGLDSAVTGLPPKDDASSATASKAPVSDPFAESNRNDGNKSNDSKTDPWTLALSTGRVNTDIKSAPAPDNSQPLIVQAPTAPTVVPSSFDASTAQPPAATETRHADASETPAKTTATVRSPVTPGGKYRVQAGDTFSSIAAKELGSKRFYTLIAKANPNVDPRRLRVGTELTIPAKQATASIRGSVEPATPTLARPIDTTRQYRVEAGDTLHGIARKLYGRSGMWQQLYDANKQLIGPDAGKLKLGMLLTLPKPAIH